MSARTYALGWGLLLTVAWCAPACAPRPAPLRFADRPVVTELDDRQPIPTPAAAEFEKLYYFTDVLVRRPIVRGLELTTPQPAEDVNALDDVPASAWYTPRLGARPLSTAELLAGPPAADGTQPPHLPLTVVRAKSGGGNPGFIAADALGRRYLIKFDPPEFPAIETTTAQIVQRLFWAFGYNVPQDNLLFFAPQDLLVGDDGGPTRADVDAVLAQVAPPRDGLYRSTASRLLEGKLLGPFLDLGRRTDDPNDRIDHENRRILRALRVFGAFVNHSDLRIDNTMDVYEGEPGMGFVRHYLLDFGEAFGGHGAEHDFRWDGFRPIFSFSELGRHLVTLGLKRESWESIEPTPWKSIGSFESKVFQPDGWRPVRPFGPIDRSLPADDYWAAKILAALQPEQLAALVQAAHYPEPGAAEYLFEVLLERRAKVLQWAFSRVTPVEFGGIDQGVWTVADQRVAAGLVPGGTQLEAAVFDAEGRKRISVTMTTDADGLAHAALLPGVVGPEGPRLIVVCAADQCDAAPARFHLRRDPDGTLRLVGVEH